VKFTTEKSAVVFNGRVFELVQEQVRYPDGRLAEVDLIRHAGAVAMLPIDSDGQLVFIRQYRHAVGGMLLEIPAGRLEAGEDPEACAQRELQEEIGMAAGWLRPLGGFYPVAGYSDEYLHIFLAGDLEASQLPGDADELIELERLSPSTALSMAARGEIQDAKTLIALFWAQAELRSL
jgi:ADP-ribose pyrophosphatase